MQKVLPLHKFEPTIHLDTRNEYFIINLPTPQFHCMQLLHTRCVEKNFTLSLNKCLVRMLSFSLRTLYFDDFGQPE